MRVLVILVLLMAWAPSAHAQLAASDWANAGVVAQFEAALLRERRAASDRELRQIADAEAGMRNARATLGRANTNRFAAERALEQARREYLQTLRAIPARNAALQIEVEAFRAEVAGALPNASPDLLEAYAAFGDGDREAAWAILDALLQARARARTAAARGIAALEIRQLAAMREVMRVNREARLRDVLTLWDQAIALDNGHFYSHLSRGQLLLALGDLQQAGVAADRALALADTAANQFRALQIQTDVKLKLGDLVAARESAQAALAAARSAAAAEPLRISRHLDVGIAAYWLGLVEFERDRQAAMAAFQESVEMARQYEVRGAADPRRTIQVCPPLLKMADLQLINTDRAGSLRSAEECERVVGQFLQANPGDTEALDWRGSALDRIGSAYHTIGQHRGAVLARGRSVEIAMQLSSADPANVRWRRGVAIAFANLAESQLALRNFTGAQFSLERSLEIATDLAAAAPTNVEAAYSVAVTHCALGDLNLGAGAPDDAIQAYQICVAGLRVLVEADPTNLRMLRALSAANQVLGDAEIRRGEVHAARAPLEESLAINRRVRDADPSDPVRQRDVWSASVRMARNFPGAGVTWSDVLTEIEALARLQLLQPSEEAGLREARERAAIESD